MLISQRKYVLDTKKNRLNETVLLSTQNKKIMLKLMSKKIFTVFAHFFTVVCAVMDAAASDAYFLYRVTTLSRVNLLSVENRDRTR